MKKIQDEIKDESYKGVRGGKVKALELDARIQEARKKNEILSIQRDQNEKRIEITYRMIDETESKLKECN